MSTPYSNEWLEERITATAALIEAYETAILALSSGSAQSYTLDTGQTRQTVTRQQVGELKNTLAHLDTRLQGYYTRRYGGATHGVPGF